MTEPVWIVDDDRSIRWVLEKALARERLPCTSFSSAAEVMAALDQGGLPRVLVSDIRMPGESGLRLLDAFKARYPQVPVIIMTAYSDLDSAVASFQGGAFDYLAKPFDVDEAVALILRALQQHGGGDEAAPDDAGGEPEAPRAPAPMLSGMLGQSPAMQELFRAIGRLSASSATVLITGESGSGKELVARALHRHSPRADRPFVALNTAAIGRDLLESELFGHERGAFTGAHTRRAGRFEEADGGTLFLDEIGDMPAELQTRLLRVLADGTFYRIGAASPVKVDVRVIAATHQPLEERVRQGTFREDLFHRLNVIRLRLPPLRNRPDDIALLAEHFLVASARSLQTEPKRLTQAAVRMLMRFSFPGNVRQLENICHWLTVMAPAQTIDVADLPPEVREDHGTRPLHASTQGSNGQGWAPSLNSGSFEGGYVNLTASSQGSGGQGGDSGNPHWVSAVQDDAARRLARGETGILHDMTRDFERALIQAALRASSGRRVEASTRIGMGRNTITRKIRELELD